MENAAKALLMAGGVLLAIMTLTLIVYMTTATSRMADIQDQKAAEKQLQAFNSSYEAYNKKRMYGADVITVVNKAINNNNSMRLENTDNPYYVNITIIPRQKFETTVYKIDNTLERPKTEGPITIDSDVERVLGINKDTLIAFFEPNIELTLGSQIGREFYSNNNFIKFFENDTEDKTKTTEDGKTTYIMYSALTNFKRAIFECTEVKYNSITGRIESMTFEQILINN